MGEALRLRLTAAPDVNLQESISGVAMETRLANPELEGMARSLVHRCLRKFQRDCPAEYNVLLQHLASQP